MTRDDAKILWPIIKAWSEGKTLQFKSGTGEWLDEGPWPSFRGHANYRIKPEQVERWAVIEKGSDVTCWSTHPDGPTKYASEKPGRRVVHFREVQED